MHSSAQVLLDPLQRTVHPLRHRCPAQAEASAAGLPAIVREAQKVERLRSPFPPRSAIACSIPAELDESGLLRVQFQLEASESFLEVAQELYRVFAPLEADDLVVGVANDDMITSPRASCGRHLLTTHKSST